MAVSPHLTIRSETSPHQRARSQMRRHGFLEMPHRTAVTDHLCGTKPEWIPRTVKQGQRNQLRSNQRYKVKQSAQPLALVLRLTQVSNTFYRRPLVDDVHYQRLSIKVADVDQA